MNLDLKAAYEQSLKYATKYTDLSVNMLKGLSAIVMRNTGAIYNTALGEFSSTNGDLRLLNVTAGVGGRSYMNYAKVPQKLEEFCTSINDRRKSISKADIVECYKLSFDIHYLLVTIHPWADGNGRMSRLVMNQVQFELGIIPTIINKDRKAEYIEALVATREQEDIEIFREFMFEEHSRNIEKMISEYKDSLESDDIEIVPANVPVNVPVNLTERELKIIELIKSNAKITAKELSEILKVSDKTIKRDIALLKERNILIRIGADKNGEWKVN